MNTRSRGLTLAVRTLALTTAAVAATAHADTPQRNTATPIKHLVVIFQENVSFDHYFAHLSAGRQPRGRACLHRQARHAQATSTR